MSTTITITISTDDDAHITSGGVPQSAAKAPPASPLAGGASCPTHHVPWTHKTGTSSKTGQPYDFWGCDVKDEAGYCKARPPKGWKPPEDVPPPPPADTYDDLPF